MIVLPLALVSAALLLGCAAGPALDRLCPSEAHPRTAVVCWLGVLAGTVAAIAGALAIALLWPPTPGHGVVEWFRGCLPHHPIVAMALAGLVSLSLLWVCWSRLARGIPRVLRAVRHRRDHREMLHMVAREDGEYPDVLLLDHPVPVAYCLPSRWRPIVVSTGARESLSPRQMRAVLEHERAHLRQRHHALLIVLDFVHALLPWAPTVRRAKAAIPLLLEMAADDAAVRAFGGGRALADALRQIATVPGFAGALAAAGPGEGALSRRLARLEPAAGRSRGIGRPLAWGFSICAAVTPLAVAVLAVGRLIVPC